MLTSATPYYTPSNGERYTTLPAEKEKFPEDSAFSSFPTLELWDCEHGSLAAEEARLFRVRFTKDRPIRLRAWANAGIGITLQDVSGRTVAHEDRADGRPNCRILPPRSEEYLLQLANTTDHEAHYVLYIIDETLQVI